VLNQQSAPVIGLGLDDVLDALLLGVERLGQL
jgi:hypothetical protein